MCNGTWESKCVSSRVNERRGRGIVVLDRVVVRLVCVRAVSFAELTVWPNSSPRRSNRLIDTSHDIRKFNNFLWAELRC